MVGGMPVTTDAPIDPLRDIHKAIRSELFAVTLSAGRCDPSDRLDRVDVAAQVTSIVGFLAMHAGHEDEHAIPVVADVRPDLAERLATDHLELDRGAAELADRATELVEAVTGQRRVAHQLYLDLAAFTGAYLTHQDLEERVLVPLLVATLGPAACEVVHRTIVDSIPPEAKAQSLAVMLPVLNIEERTELLAGMRAGAPPAVFADLWSLAGSVLPTADRAALAARLGLA